MQVLYQRVELTNSFIEEQRLLYLIQNDVGHPVCLIGSADGEVYVLFFGQTNSMTNV